MNILKCDRRIKLDPEPVAEMCRTGKPMAGSLPADQNGLFDIGRFGFYPNAAARNIEKV